MDMCVVVMQLKNIHFQNVLKFPNLIAHCMHFKSQFMRSNTGIIFIDILIRPMRVHWSAWMQRFFISLMNCAKSYFVSLNVSKTHTQRERERHKWKCVDFVLKSIFRTIDCTNLPPNQCESISIFMGISLSSLTLNQFKIINVRLRFLFWFRKYCTLR